MRRTGAWMSLAVLLGMAASSWAEEAGRAGSDAWKERRAAWRENRRERIREFVLDRVSSHQTMMEEMNLTQEQKTEVFLLMLEYKPEFTVVAEEAKERRQALVDLVLCDEQDEKAIRKLSAELGEILGKMALMASEFVADAKTILTEDQVHTFMKFQAAKQNDVDGLFKGLRGAGPVQ